MERPLDEVLASFDDSLELKDAWTIPGDFYTDLRVERLERKNVFGKSWQMVGRLAQLEEPGRFIATEVAGERVVVVRGHDGALRAFFNVCRHHAAAVVMEPAGCAERLRCPYHGWTYSLDGALRSTPEFEGVCGFDRADHGLVPLRVATWEKFVFVNLDPDAPALDAHLGRLVKDLEPLGLDKLTFFERREYELQCNWKVFVDNYLDGGYHVPFLHRGLNSILSYKDYTIECFDRACLQSSPIDTSVGEAMTASVRHGRALYYWLYPNLMLNWYEGYLDTNLVVPLGIDRMKVIFEFYFADGSEASRERNTRSVEVSERIQDEDHAICESVQKGLASRAYGAGRLSVRREAGENLFHKLLVRDLRASRRSLL